MNSGYSDLCITVLDGSIDLFPNCFQGADLTPFSSLVYEQVTSQGEMPAIAAAIPANSGLAATATITPATPASSPVAPFPATVP